MALIRVLNKTTGRYEPVKPTIKPQQALEQRVQALEAKVAILTSSQHTNTIKA